jgi:NhaA family Na+:H+ antiporter
MSSLLAPIERFMHIEVASGIVLMAAAAIALVWANSPWADSYTAMWAFEVGVTLGDLALVRPLGWVVNDILMAVFFFVIGLEIRRELAFGALDSWQKAALPVAAAIGGMVVPAALYVLAAPTSARAGWGVPMATDIAFALGVLALLGKRVPPVVRIALLGLAVIDDLGAIIVIAIFYSSGIAWSNLALAAVGLLSIAGLQRAGVRRKLIYVVPAGLVWIGAYTGGLHPTIAGVLVGVMTPVRAWMEPRELADELAPQISALRDAEAMPPETVQALAHARRESRSPATDLIERLHPWVAFVIMPVFALANAGVTLDGGGGADGIGLAVSLGLVVGKPIGVLLAVVAAVSLGVAALPPGVGVRELLVLGVVAGIGFTMSLFIASLAFTDAAMLGASKLGVLIASAIAAALTLVLGRVLLRAPPPS